MVSSHIKLLIVVQIVCVGVILHVYTIPAIFKNNYVLAGGSVTDRVKEITNCLDKYLDTKIQRRGNFWVLYNYVRPEKRYKCSESITLTTPADYTFLDNIIPLVQSWQGPISVALYAPGYDFEPTLDSIAYLRNCGEENNLVKQFVTFHIFFNDNHLPKNTSLKSYEIPLKSMYKDTYDCNRSAPYEEQNIKMLYKTVYKLTYPINVARNIARTTAQTHFVLASDIELYPTSNLISKFLKMVAVNKELFQNKTPKVFPLPIFEVLKNESIPSNKTVLQQMMLQKRAFNFHKLICNSCHAIPNATKWIITEENEDLNVFITTKRQGKYKYWEPVYIGTHEDPLFDERLSWEGQSNKIEQNYEMCLLNYDYMVLDNAFLTHKPGVKKGKVQMKMYGGLIRKTNKLLKNQIQSEVTQLYGKTKACKIIV